MNNVISLSNFRSNKKNNINVNDLNKILKNNYDFLKKEYCFERFGKSLMIISWSHKQYFANRGKTLRNQLHLKIQSSSKEHVTNSSTYKEGFELIKEYLNQSM